MIKILDTLTYKSGTEVLPNVLYTHKSDPILLQGRVYFQVLGKAILNSIPLESKTYKFNFRQVAELAVDMKSAVIIFNIEKPFVSVPEHLPVPPVPEHIDAHEALTRDIIQRVLSQYGLGRPKEGGSEADIDEQFGDEEFDDDFDFAPDTDSLLPDIQDEPEAVPDVQPIHETTNENELPAQDSTPESERDTILPE